MVKVLLIGSGGREHAIAKFVKKGEDVKLYGYLSGRNPGIIGLCEEYRVGDITDPVQVTAYAEEKGIDLAIVGPEAPLEVGVIDSLEEAGIGCVGPRREAARIETDKAFCKELMAKYGTGGVPEFKVFQDPQEACRYLDAYDKPVAIKPAGLTGGKGVKVMGDHLKDVQEAKEYVVEIFEKGIGTLPKVVVEEKLEGEEFSLQAFTDGERLLATPCVQDHKRALEGDRGLNTGGMGSYSDKDHLLPFLTRQDLEKSLEIMERTIQAIKKEVGTPFKGILYGGFIATAKGPMILEFNARLGDPEAINILPIFEGDPIELLYGVAEGSLSPKRAGFKKLATVCKYLVPKSYVDPSLPKISEPIEVDEEGVKRVGAELFYASVNMADGRLMTTKSRSLAVLGVDEDLYRAEEIAEEATRYVAGNLYHRRDIGTKELVERRVKHMEEVRRGGG